MVGDFSYIQRLYEEIRAKDKLSNEYCVAFVYNSADKIRDTIHASECVFPEERDMIISSFRKSVKWVYSFDGEESFARSISSLKAKHQYVLVYSMAQNLNGIGRRCLVPLLCDYYGLINIGAGFMECVYGGSKYLMYEMLQETGIRFPKTYYILSKDDLDCLANRMPEGKWLLKPNDESASIGIEVIEMSKYTKSEFKEKLIEYRKMFPIFCLQEFIEGDEVAVPLLKYKSTYYCPGISQVVFRAGKTYLDYDTVALGDCSYCEYTGPLSDILIANSIKVAEKLDYKAISRVDFRIKDEICYIEDIGPNPTISEFNGVNELFRTHLNASGSCVYQLLLFAAMGQNCLFEPSFDNTP